MARARTGGIVEDRRGETVRYAIRYRLGGERRYEITDAATREDAAAILAARLAGAPRSSSGRRPLHGQAGRTAEYRSWKSMKQRCYLPSYRGYQQHGGRGVVVCAVWRDSFVAFFADMGAKPTPQHGISRVDPDGNYSCGHCEECLREGWPANARWATKSEQSRSRRRRLGSALGSGATFRPLTAPPTDG